MSSSSRATSQLWRPGMAIRFSPKHTSERVYPDLDAVRPIELPRTLSTNALEQPDSPSQPTSFDTGVAPPAFSGQQLHQQDEASRSAQEKAPRPEKGSSVSPLLRKWSFLAAGKAPETDLAYKLSKSRYENAQKCAVDTPGSFWSYTMYEQKSEDGLVQNVKVHYCTSRHTMENVCKRYFENEKVLGFDMEWMSNANRLSGPRQNVSLIQIASPSRIALFHIALYPKDDFIAPTFHKLMGDSTVIKAGVNILADATRLRNNLGVDMAGVFETSNLYNLVLYSRTRRPGRIPKTRVSMATQVKECLGLPMFKQPSVRAGEWMSPLSSRQLQYAASDAYAGLQLYHVLEQHRLQLKPCPPRPHYAELRRDIERADGDLEEISVEENFIDESITDEDLLALEESLVQSNILPRPAHAEPSPADKLGSSHVQTQQRDSRLAAADVLVQNYISRAKKTAIRPAALRAYYVWHENMELTPAGVAGLLRDPPLQTNTVVSYILDAVTSEHLPYSKPRMAGEVLALVHPSAVRGRYQALAEECELAIIPATTTATAN